MVKKAGTRKSSTKKASYKDKQQIAYDLYINTDKSQKEICELVDISPNTFTSWKQDGGWELLKGADVATTGSILARLYSRLKELSEADTLNADQLIKVASTIEKLSEGKTTISQMLKVFKEFTTYAFSIDPELAKRINTLQSDFVKEKVNGRA